MGNSKERFEFWMPIISLLMTFIVAFFLYKQISLLKTQTQTLQTQTQILKNNVDIQNKSVSAQIKDLQLGKRPYVYAEVLNPTVRPRIEVKGDGTTAVHYSAGAKLWFKNEGSIPAVITNIQYFVTTDKDRKHLDLPNYFEEGLGSFPYPTIIFPKQENLRFNYLPDGSGGAERLYFNIVVSYKGYDDKKNYWYSFRSKYATLPRIAEQEVSMPDGNKKRVTINLFELIPLEIKGGWDKDSNFDVPKVDKPNWKIEEEQITRQRELLKGR